MMLGVPSRPSSAPPDPAEQEQWIIVQHSKPKSPNNQQHTHAYPHNKSKQHGLLPPHPHHQSRRKSQSEVDSSISASSVASSASSSRRSSLSQIQSAEFASFRRGSGSGSGSRANQDGDWRRTTATAPNENVGVTVPAGTVIATTPTNMSDNAKKKDTPKSKKTPKTSHRNLPPRSNTPVQPHAVIHQLGHSRFSLGPTDFPDLTFRRIIWQQERSAAANSAETSLTNATTAIAVPIADDVALIGDRASDSVTVQLPSEIESDDILIQSDSSNDIVEVVHNPKQAMAEVGSSNDVTADVAPPAEVIVATESTIAVPLSSELPANENENAAADDEDDKITAIPIDSIESPSLTSPSSKSKKKKKKKNSSNQSANVPTEPVEQVEPSTPIEAVDSDEAIKPVDEDTIDATSSAPSVTMSDDTELSDQFSNYRSLLLPIAYSLVALLILLASFFPISRVLTIPTALLLLAGIITLHHPMIESKLPPALQFRSLFPSTASDQFSKDNLALLSHTNMKKAKQTKKKGKGGRR